MFAWEIPLFLSERRVTGSDWRNKKNEVSPHRNSRLNRPAEPPKIKPSKPLGDGRHQNSFSARTYPDTNKDLTKQSSHSTWALDEQGSTLMIQPTQTPSFQFSC